MLSVIACALVSSFTKYVATKAFNSLDEVKIGGAPSWYMKPTSDNMCVFTHSKGGLDSIEIAKKNATIKMTRNINNVVEISIYDNTKQIKDPKEKSMIKLWSKDTNLNMFVRKNIDYNKIVYEDNIDTTFVRACIPNKTIIDYQDERLKKIKDELLNFKVNSAFDELENELNSNSN
jgi:hypothetical protein